MMVSRTLFKWNSFMAVASVFTCTVSPPVEGSKQTNMSNSVTISSICKTKWLFESTKLYGWIVLNTAANLQTGGGNLIV